MRECIGAVPAQQAVAQSYQPALAIIGHRADVATHHLEEDAHRKRGQHRGAGGCAGLAQAGVGFDQFDTEYFSVQPNERLVPAPNVKGVLMHAKFECS